MVLWVGLECVIVLYAVTCFFDPDQVDIVIYGFSNKQHNLKMCFIGNFRLQFTETYLISPVLEDYMSQGSL